MTETKYGVISDVHQDPRIVKVAIDKLKAQGVEKLLVNGDIGIHANSLKESQQYTGFILDTIGKSGLESFVQPGSHETISSYEPVIDFFAGKYSNIIDTLKNPKVEFGSHHLAFLPGSDWNAGGEYTFGNQDGLPTGTYIQTTKGLVAIDTYEQFIDVLNNPNSPIKGIQGLMHYNNMSDLRTTITQPDKTIVVCHVPRRFDNVDTGVDMAYFAENREKAVMPGIALEETIKKQLGNVPPTVIKNFALQNGWTLKRENRGNEDLKNLYSELGITKAVSGHFHESSHRATDSNGIIVPQNTFVDNLYWNAGHLDVGHAGILIVKNGKVNYQNITIN